MLSLIVVIALCADYNLQSFSEYLSCILKGCGDDFWFVWKFNWCEIGVGVLTWKLCYLIYLN